MKLALETMEKNLNCSEVLGKRSFIAVDFYHFFPYLTRGYPENILQKFGLSPIALAGSCIRSRF